MSSTAQSLLQVMVVDDQGTMRSILRQLLANVGIDNVLEAENGEKALEILQGCTQKMGGQLPDVIISDLHMDGMDGMEFCNTLRRSKKLEIPVIILTGDSDRLLHETTLQVGAVAIMTKPVSAGDLIQKIEEVVGFSVN